MRNVLLTERVCPEVFVVLRSVAAQRARKRGMFSLDVAIYSPLSFGHVGGVLLRCASAWDTHNVAKSKSAARLFEVGFLAGIPVSLPERRNPRLTPTIKQTNTSVPTTPMSAPCRTRLCVRSLACNAAEASACICSCNFLICCNRGASLERGRVFLAIHVHLQFFALTLLERLIVEIDSV